jgi:AHBA synthesis associated protein
MTATVSTVLFDLDGVLIDSEALMRYAFVESYRRVLGAGTAPVERYLSYSGNSFLRIMDRLGLPHELYPHFREISTRHVGMLRPVAGMVDVLAGLAQLNLRMAVVTGKDAERTAQILELLSLADYFEVVVCSDMVGKPKPNPESVYRALVALDARSDEAVLVGDAVCDIVAARRAGVAAVGVSWGLGTREHLEGVGADVVVDSPAELASLLTSSRASVVLGAGGLECAP